jgi:hypothetical protein
MLVFLAHEMVVMPHAATVVTLTRVSRAMSGGAMAVARSRGRRVSRNR